MRRAWQDHLNYLAAVLVLLTLVCATWWAADRARRSVQPDPPRRISHEPDFFIERFGMVRSDPQGTAHTVLQGERLVHFPDDDSSELSEPRFWSSRPNQPLVQVRARQGRLDQDGSRVTLEGDVLWQRAASENRAPMRISTARMTVLPDDEIAQGELPVTVLQGGHALNGVGFHYDNQSRQLHINQRSSVRIAPRNAANLETPT